MKKSDKKAYSTPTIRKVHLEVKESVLGTCHSSPVLTPSGEFGCSITENCWDGTGFWPGG
jgi:hypothetical protein